jgi:hypothetical protein
MDKRGQSIQIFIFLELELLYLPNTFLQLQRESPAPRWSCKLVEQQLQSGFGGAGALPNMPIIGTQRFLLPLNVPRHNPLHAMSLSTISHVNIHQIIHLRLCRFSLTN